MLEAPITGGLEALKKGQMTVFMAGEKDLAEQVSKSIWELGSKCPAQNAESAICGKAENEIFSNNW